MLVELNNISHSFGEGELSIHALKNIDFTLKAGEVVLLMGPSGSGKTTLLQVIGALLIPDAGEILIDQIKTNTLIEEEREAFRLAHYGFVFQNYNLFPMLTALENIAVGLDILGYSKKAAYEAALELLSQVHLKERAHSYPDALSGGQKQRIAIARALAGHPKLILADEPTASLDIENGHMVMQLMSDLAKTQNRGVIVVTHDHRLQKWADRIVELEDGAIKNRV